MGDQLAAVEWNQVSGCSEWEVRSLLYGREGTSVTLEISSLASGLKKHVTLVRMKAGILDPKKEANDGTTDMLCCGSLLKSRQRKEPEVQPHEYDVIGSI